MSGLTEEIAGQVMAEIVRRHEENDDPVIDLVSLWEAIDVSVTMTVQHLSKIVGGLPLAALARSSPAVMNEIRAGKKIQAIKELRAISRAGLKEAKEAVDQIWAEDGIPPSGPSGAPS